MNQLLFKNDEISDQIEYLFSSLGPQNKEGKISDNNLMNTGANTGAEPSDPLNSAE